MIPLKQHESNHTDGKIINTKSRTGRGHPNHVQLSLWCTQTCPQLWCICYGWGPQYNLFATDHGMSVVLTRVRLTNSWWFSLGSYVLKYWISTHIFCSSAHGHYKRSEQGCYSRGTDQRWNWRGSGHYASWLAHARCQRASWIWLVR